MPIETRITKKEMERFSGDAILATIIEPLTQGNGAFLPIVSICMNVRDAIAVVERGLPGSKQGSRGLVSFGGDKPNNIALHARMEDGIVAWYRVTDGNDLTEAVVRLLQSKDSFAAIDLIEEEGTANKIAFRYYEVCNEDRIRDNLSYYSKIAHAGVRFCMRALKEGGSEKGDLGIRQSAQAICERCAYHHWPGWEEKGKAVTREQIVTGLGFALQCLRSAQTLALPPKKIAECHWLIGALRLSLKEYDKARDSFHAAIEVTKVAHDSCYALFVEGFLGMADVLEGNELGSARMAKAISTLKSLTDNTSDAYVERIQHAFANIKALG
ncbi:MAG: hypothetical protein KIS92_05135 [Planctomycetota bacterium]|nr:hypothetical protein [Planctomycetota bacterium]